MQPSDYFTPDAYQYMDCNDADLAAGGLLMIPGTGQLLAGGKTSKLFLVNAANLGHEQANDAGAAQTLQFDGPSATPQRTVSTPMGITTAPQLIRSKFSGQQRTSMDRYTWVSLRLLPLQPSLESEGLCIPER